MLDVWIGHFLQQEWQTTGKGEPEKLWIPYTEKCQGHA